MEDRRGLATARSDRLSRLWLGREKAVGASRQNEAASEEPCRPYTSISHFAIPLFRFFRTHQIFLGEPGPFPGFD